MKFYNYSEIPPVGRDDKIFKAPLSNMIGVLLFFAIGIALVIWGFQPGERPRIALIGYGAFTILVSFLFMRMIVGTFRATNWIIRCGPGGVIIKYRYYLNYNLPQTDPQAVSLDYSEIAWVRKKRMVINTPELNGRSASQNVTYIEFGLYDSDTSELKKMIDAECQVKAESRYMGCPVQVLDDGVIRVEWRGIVNYFLPGDGAVIKYLGRYVSVRPKGFEEMDLATAGSTPTETDEKIRHLAQRGEMISAIELTRRIYRCSLTDAKKYIDNI